MFGEGIIDSIFIVAAFIAFFSGMLSFLSPCVLPIVPPFLAYIGGVESQNSKNISAKHPSIILLTCFFVFGLSTIFIILGASASFISSFFIKNQTIFGQIAGVIIILFGIHFIGVFRIGLLNYDMRFHPKMKSNSAFSAYILGMAFAFGWTPCMGPHLAAILSLAAQDTTYWRGAFLLSIYALGLGIPFILAAVFFDRLGPLVTRMRPYMRHVEIVMGVFLVIIGTMVFSGTLSALSYWLLEKFPFLALFG